MPRPLLVASLSLALCSLASSASAADFKSLSRSEAIQRQLASLNREAEEHGGWDAWAESLRPLREDLQRAGTKPAGNFTFRPAEFALLKLARLDQGPPVARPLEVIVDLDRQLKARGIELIFVPLPDKLSIYTNKLVVTGDGHTRPPRLPDDRLVAVQVKHLLARLLENDVEAIDLYTYFCDFRRKHGDKLPLHYDAGVTLIDRITEQGQCQRRSCGGTF